MRALANLPGDALSQFTGQCSIRGGRGHAQHGHAISDTRDDSPPKCVTLPFSVSPLKAPANYEHSRAGRQQTTSA